MERPRASRAGLAALSHHASSAARRASCALLAAVALSAAACRSASRPEPEPRPTPAPGDSALTAADTGTRNGRALVDPSTAVRFEIVGVRDSTFAFLAPNAPWLAVGSIGIAVDPRRRDMLVARFRVLSSGGDTATALVTGQTTRLVTDHVALVSRPPTPPVVLRRIERRRFWAGAAVGAVFGVIAGLLVQ